MDDLQERPRCQATTKAGRPCQNRAMAGSRYCRVHQSVGASQKTEAVESVPNQERVSAVPNVESTSAPAEVEAESGKRVVVHTVATEPGPQPVRDAQWETLVNELSALAHEIQKRVPAFVPPPFEPEKLIALLRTNMEMALPESQREMLAQLQRNLQDATVKDLVDPETWKGAWYIVNYLLQAQKDSVKESVVQRLAALPGADVVMQLKGNLEETKVKDLLDPATWKGLLYIVSHTAQQQLQEAKRRMGKQDVEF